MPRLAKLVFAFAFLPLMFTAAHAQSTPVAPADETQVRAAVDGMIDAWNKHDMRAFTSYMADDVQWINVRGSWWSGKAEVYKQHKHLHDTIFKTRNLYAPEKVEIRAVAPGVIIATSFMKADPFNTPDGHAEPESMNALTEVFVQRGGKWLIVEGHNTVVVPSGPPPAAARP